MRHMDKLSLCRKHMAVLFELEVQAVPTTSIPLDRSPARDGRTAPAVASGFLRLVLSAETNNSSFSRPMRKLTEPNTIPYTGAVIMETVL